MFMEQKHYEVPELECFELHNESVLCESQISESTLQEYEEITYEW